MLDRSSMKGFFHSRFLLSCWLCLSVILALVVEFGDAEMKFFAVQNVVWAEITKRPAIAALASFQSIFTLHLDVQDTNNNNNNLFFIFSKRLLSHLGLNQPTASSILEKCSIFTIAA